ncbi:MAG TPA: hypothetical protein VGY66_17915 [Gemmataceae bacterium]|nr:hypothetical protein [Gemmataceae bacterium]
MIDILTGLNRRNKVQRVLVLRCGDKHGVNAFVIQQTAKVGMNLELRSHTLDGIEAVRVDIGGSHTLGIGAPESGFEYFGAARAGPNQTEPHPVIRAQDGLGRQHRAGYGGSRGAGYLPEKRAPARR